MARNRTAHPRRLTVERLETRNMFSVGSNSQLPLPRHLYLADVNADGRDDFLQVAENRVFAFGTNSARTGLLHHYLDDPISRLVTGNFAGTNHDDVCAVTTHATIECFRTTADSETLEPWFSQSSFLLSNDSTIVADFNGDNRADMLVYNSKKEELRMYSVTAGSRRFAAMPNFSLGNLDRAEAEGLQFRSGDVNGDGRDDLVVINSIGQVSYFRSVFDGRQNTFWWSWTSATGLIKPGDQVQLARINSDATADLVIHNVGSGATTFRRMAYNNGRPPLLDVSVPAVFANANTLLFFRRLQSLATNRDDAIVFDDIIDFSNASRSTTLVNASGNISYTTIDSQPIPSHDVGWPAHQETPWLVLKCRPSNHHNESPHSNQFYHEMFGKDGANGAVTYWRDITYGTYDLTGTLVFGPMVHDGP